MTSSAPRRIRPQLVLSVVATERLTPHLVRVTLGGDDFDAFESNDATDKYVKIFFAKPELGLTPPYEIHSLKKTVRPDDLPVTRTYTVRRVDESTRTLCIDFVVHGDEGLAGPWAASARPGDELVLSGPGGKYAPEATADWHLFAGDESALPAISSALEALPAHARGVAFLEAYTEADALQLEAPAGIELRWLFRNDAAAGTTSLLRDALEAKPWLPGRPQIFAHGERGTMKALRDVFKARGVTKSDVSLSGYWAYGRTEDRFQAEKSEPIGEIPPISD